ncbi:MAG: capsular biosynthesis protein [Bryobacteraceae bacterium]|nr:capsular biosynthesis protein [Bryobacteraceae bacterium]
MRYALALVCLGLYGQTVAELERELTAQRRLLNDWAGLTRYGSDNAEIKSPPAVVFLGDEITEKWEPFFEGKPYLNRGLARQSSAQMLLRFRQDVISLKPKLVIIQAGTNDIAGTAGPTTEAMSAENFMSMVELAKANGIRVILASVTPVWETQKRRPAGKIIGLNGWLKSYAAKVGATYLDYYSALASGRVLRKEFTNDGLVPNAAGYAAMAPLAEAAIAEAMAKP